MPPAFVSGRRLSLAERGGAGAVFAEIVVVRSRIKPIRRTTASLRADDVSLVDTPPYPGWQAGTSGTASRNGKPGAFAWDRPDEWCGCWSDALTSRIVP